MTDVICLLALVWALRLALPRNILALLPFVAASTLVALPFYGGAPPGQIALIDLPTWATVSSVAVWPLV